MKRFVRKSTLFFLILFALSHARPLYLLHKDRYQRSGAGSETYYSIHKSKERNGSSPIVLLGDSVARELFNNKTNDNPIYSLACNQAIGMVGHYILLRNYLRAGNHVDAVYLLFSPFSFSNNLDQVYTYHYFLKPFYTKEYYPLFTKTVIDQIHKIPYYYLSRYPHILTSNLAPDFASKDKIDYKFLSPISAEYLARIKELSIQYGFRLVLISPPTNVRYRQRVEEMKTEAMNSSLKTEFEDYFRNMLYVQDDNFVSDGVHLKNPQKFSDYYRNSLMK
jgi:hypothetical protein